MELQTIPLSQIRPYWRNPRRNDAAVEAAKASIQRYGFNVPLVLDEKLEIVAGHTRYRALLSLGHTEAPCIILKGLPADKIKEYRIADNKVADLSEWDMGALIPELRELQEVDAMIPYFGQANLDALLAETGGVNMDLPTQKQIDEAKAKMDGQFDARSADWQESYVDLICPHCGESFAVSKIDIESQAKAVEKFGG